MHGQKNIKFCIYNFYCDYFYIDVVFDLAMDRWKVKYIELNNFHLLTIALVCSTSLRKAKK
jgi:hypothetical protein